MYTSEVKPGGAVTKRRVKTVTIIACGSRMVNASVELDKHMAVLALIATDSGSNLETAGDIAAGLSTGQEKGMKQKIAVPTYREYIIL